jgi:hypothetical protein
MNLSKKLKVVRNGKTFEQWLNEQWDGGIREHISPEFFGDGRKPPESIMELIKIGHYETILFNLFEMS